MTESASADTEAPPRTSEERVVELERELAEARGRERRLLAALDGVGDALWIGRLRDGRIHHEHVSPATATLFGLDAAALDRDPLAWLAVVHPQDRPEVERLVRAPVPAAGMGLEYRVVGPAGVRWLRSTVAIHTEGDDVLVAGFFTDVTEAREAAERLRDEVGLLRTTLEALPGIVACVDTSLRCLLVNQRCADWFGRARPEDLLGRSLTDALEDDLASYLPYVRRALAGETVRFDRQATNADGLTRDVALTFAPHGEDGHVQLLVALIEDVTERRAEEAAVRERAERLSLVLEGSPDGFWDLDTTTGRSFFSPRWFSMLGYTPGELEPHVSTWERLLHPDDLIRARSALAEHLAGRTPRFTVEVRMRCKSGEWLWILSRGTVVRRDELGRARRMCGTHHDLTDRKQAEDALRRSNRALRVISAINTALIRVESADSFLSELCWVLVGVAGYRSACLQVLAETGVVRLVAEAGPSEPAGDARSSAREGVATSAIRTNELQVVPADSLGGCVLAALPVRLQVGGLGALTLTAEPGQAFDADELALLREIARDLEFGLEALRVRGEHERLAASLREGEARFRGVFQHAAVGIALLDEEGTVVEANPRLLAMLGLDPDETDRERLSATLRADSDGQPLRDLVRGRRSSYQEERRYLRKDGSAFHGRVTASVARRKGPHSPALVVKMVEDLGPIEAAEALKAQRLREEEAVSRVALDALAGHSQQELEEKVCALVRATAGADYVGLFDLLPGGAAVRLRVGAGWPPGVLGVTTLPVAPGESIDRALRSAQPFELLGAPDSALASLGVADGVVTPLLDGQQAVGLLGVFWRTRALGNGSSRFLGAIASILALARRRFEATAALGRSNSLLAEAHDRAARDERLRALGHLASGIAHDFNNHLTPILGFTDLLLENQQVVTDPKVQRYLKSVKQAAEGAGRVVARLREFYRPREGHEDVTLVDPNTVMVDAMGLAEPKWRDDAQMQGKAVRFENALLATGRLVGCEHEVRDAALNLILNAVDALRPAGGVVSLRTRDEGDTLVVEVRDDGVGMTDEVRQRCFEPFFTTKGDRGTGLGLAQVWGIVRRHHGELDIQSAPGHGTSVSMRFPARRPTEQAAERQPLAVRGPLRVLVVDDEAPTRDLLRDALSLDGHAPVVVEAGHVALERLRAGGVDLLLTDRSMPGMSGDRVAAEARALAPDLPIIMLTGYGEFMSPLERPAGVDLVLSKPITVETLRKGLAEAVARRHPADPTDQPPAEAAAALRP